MQIYDNVEGFLQKSLHVCQRCYTKWHQAVAGFQTIFVMSR